MDGAKVHSHLVCDSYSYRDSSSIVLEDRVIKNISLLLYDLVIDIDKWPPLNRGVHRPAMTS